MFPDRSALLPPSKSREAALSAPRASPAHKRHVKTNHTFTLDNDEWALTGVDVAD
jgi:hypothetical protein